MGTIDELCALMAKRFRNAVEQRARDESASLWWCDGKRNLNEIKELCELEAGRPVSNFDLIKYYRFLENHGLVPG